ncbi:TBC1 domain family member 13 [Durusdinium trenchii]|uniref:TBC1 domain family member 13 n=1 Tax=Durusdinium trenchii TaxID=1381693 RepID=A0ABP0NU40_9DINO
MATGKGDKDIFKAFEEETDAFFDSLMNEGPAPKASGYASDSPVPTPASAASATLPTPEPTRRVQASMAEVAMEEPGQPRTEQSEVKTDSASVAVYRMDSDGSDELPAVPGTEAEELQMAPAPPADFSSEDRALHEALEDFYWRRRATNLSNINAIVVKYRGVNVSHLWAQLAIKYNVPPAEGVEMLARSLYGSSPYEYSQKELRVQLEEKFAEVRREVLADGLTPSKAQLLDRALQRGAQDGSDALLRLLTFRGLPDEDQQLRAQVWKVLLGYLPMKRHDEWNAIQGEKRAMYMSYRSELLSTSATQQVSVSRRPHSPGGEIEDEELLQEIKNDVERTRRDLEYFRRPETKAALTALLFVYAKLNPGVRYVQGMNEIAAILLYVMSVNAESAESDAFWCFSEMMVEIKEGFMQAMDHSGEGAVRQKLSRFLPSPGGTRHLHKAELSLFVFVLRWCTVLFAQELKAAAPPVSCDLSFVVHTCVAVILGKREALLATDKQFSLAEANRIMQAGPRGTDFDELLRRANAICAFERRGDQEPIFPPRRLQVMDDLNEWAQTAAERASEAAAVASEVGAEVSKNFQEKIAPVVRERAGQASEIVQDKAQALQSWLHETAPARKEAFEQAQTQLSSFWQSVRTKGQQFAAEAAGSETANTAAARLSSAAESASGFWARASTAFANMQEAPREAGEPRPHS